MNEQATALNHSERRSPEPTARPRPYLAESMGVFGHAALLLRADEQLYQDKQRGPTADLTSLTDTSTLSEHP